jgi:hypothetical protein
VAANEGEDDGQPLRSASIPQLYERDGEIESDRWKKGILASAVDHAPAPTPSRSESELPPAG